jgi:hypothetical protein
VPCNISSGGVILYQHRGDEKDDFKRPLARSEHKVIFIFFEVCFFPEEIPHAFLKKDCGHKNLDVCDL